ncbi:hypothetical protein FEE95_06800 [Maribacter algarum]|uniref:Signal transduction histidine kinase internal region domain-containing protein n=1 Tax=Maribacter algarum (ex Zhang et al. 2020) TaxID=2578118 RepID=A0A5S3QMK9_9FLAO|nr:histidine kinase [Maribacter algarum]TMM59134.1 hypothetical protein FEE95_06800 [Maribacter algarum]
MRFFFILSLFVLHLKMIAQTPKYTQAFADSFAIRPLSEENLQKFKGILESNKKLYGWSKYYALHGYYKMVKAEHDSALFYAQKSIDIYQNILVKHSNEEKSLVHAYFTLGYINRQRELYRESTSYMLTALDLSSKYSISLKSYITNNIASNHLSLGNDQKALDYFRKNIKDSLFIKSAQSEITTLTRMGVLYSKTYLNKIDSADYFFRRALRRSHDSDYKNNLPFIYGNLAGLTRGINQDSALFYYKKSKEWFEVFVNDPNSSPDNTDFYQVINNSYVDIHENKIDKAILDLKLAIDSLKPYIDNKNDRDILSDAYENLILAYEKKNEFKKANTILKEQLEFENEFSRKQLDQELEKLQIDYETEKKEEEIVILKGEAIKTDTILQQQRTITYSAIGLGLLALALGGLFYRQRLLKEKFRQVSLEQRLLRSQMNPHFLFNALNTASVLVDTKAAQAKTYIQKLAKLLRLTLENSREDYVPFENEINALESYLELQSNFAQNFNYDIIIDDAIETQIVEIPPMLIQPFIENAIIHGISKTNKRGYITLEIKKGKEKTLMCSITDNGPGFNHISADQKIGRKSLSLSIVKERLAVYQKNNKQRFIFKTHAPLKNGTQTTDNQVNFSMPFHTI